MSVDERSRSPVSERAKAQKSVRAIPTDAQFAYILIIPVLIVFHLTLQASFGRLEDANQHVKQVDRLYTSTVETLAMAIAGGMAPVSTRGKLNRDGLQTSLDILRGGNRLGIFPEGWGHAAAPLEVLPLKRGVAFLSEHSGRRVLPVGLAGTTDFWRGATLRVRIAPPLDALPSGADRLEEQEFVDRLRAVMQAAVPDAPPQLASGKKPWRWLTRLM